MWTTDMENGRAGDALHSSGTVQQSDGVLVEMQNDARTVIDNSRL